MFQINTTRPVWRSRSTHACERPRERLYTESMTNKAKPSATAAGVDASPEPHEGRTARRVTLDDIAIVAGTSIATVSRALQGSPRVAPSTRERIEKVAEQLGYQANIAASLLASSRPQILGLVCALGQELHVRYRAEALRAAERHGFRIIVESIDDSRDVERAWESVLQLRAQSVIAVDSSCISQSYAHVPTVLIGQQAVREDLDLITSDNERGMREAVTLLRDRGRRRIAFIEGPPLALTSQLFSGPAAVCASTMSVFQEATTSMPASWPSAPGCPPGWMRSCATTTSAPTARSSRFCATASSPVETSLLSAAITPHSPLPAHSRSPRLTALPHASALSPSTARSHEHGETTKRPCASASRPSWSCVPARDDRAQRHHGPVPRDHQPY